LLVPWLLLFLIKKLDAPPDKKRDARVFAYATDVNKRDATAEVVDKTIQYKKFYKTTVDIDIDIKTSTFPLPKLTTRASASSVSSSAELVNISCTK
jgi:hypothetical protein